MHLPLHFLTSPTLTGGSPYQVNLYSYAWLMKSRRVEEGRVNLVWRCDVRKSTAILFPTLFVRVHPPSFYSVILTGKRTSRRVKVCRRESGGVINGRGTPRYRSLGVYPLQRRGYKFYEFLPTSQYPLLYDTLVVLVTEGSTKEILRGYWEVGRNS